MLENTFYKSTSFQFENGMIHSEVELQKEHPIFKGHFPNNPVTPGVCMLQIIKELVQKATHTHLFLQQCSQVKFMALINPETHPLLKIEIQVTEEAGGFKIKCNTRFDNTVALKLNGRLKKMNS